MLRSIASKTIVALSTAVAATAFTASINAQTIIVDGVTYQAISASPSAPSAPATPFVGYAAPAPLALPAARVYPVQQPVLQPAPTQAQAGFTTTEAVAPFLIAAMGLWALNDWFSGDNRGHQRRVHGSQPHPTLPAHPGHIRH
jgi:hypothetical protein